MRDFDNSLRNRRFKNSTTNLVSVFFTSFREIYIGIVGRFTKLVEQPRSYARNFST